MEAKRITRSALGFCCVLLFVAANTNAADNPKLQANPFVKLPKVQNPGATAGGAAQEHLDEVADRVPAVNRDKERGYRLNPHAAEIQFGNGIQGRVPPATGRVSTRYRHGGGAKGILPNPPNPQPFLQNRPRIQVPIPATQDPDDDQAKAPDDSTGQQ